MKKIILSSLVMFFSFLSIFSQESVEINAFKSHLEFLSNNDMNGRFVGTAENTKAMNYIKEQFESLGLEKVNNSYLQTFNYIDSLEAGKNCRAEFKVLIRKPGVPEHLLKWRGRNWEIGKDWLPMRFSATGKAEGELVFCGYGVTAPELNYDDYAGIDVNNKIVIVLADSSEGMPLDDFFYPYSDLSYKAENAAKHGAAAIVFVKVLHDSANVFYKFDYDRNFKAPIPAIQANRTEIAKIFPKDSPLLKVEKEINETHKPKSFIIPDNKLSLEVQINLLENSLSNIIGILPGTDNDLKNEYIVIGANFDGFGSFWHEPKWRPKVWTVLNSANYNASGIAELIELAKFFKTNPLKRSIIFVAFNGNTIGQVGSKYFIKNPVVPKEKIKFMINLCGVGNTTLDKLYLIGTGTFTDILDYSALNSIEPTLTIAKSIRSLYQQDFLSFYLEQIPTLLITGGFDTKYGTRFDTPDKIDYSTMNKIYNVSKEIITQIGNYNAQINFNPDPLLNDYKRAAKGYGCKLGITTNLEYVPNGIIVSDIKNGSPADNSGIKVGDILLKLNGISIKNEFDLYSAERQIKPNEQIEAIILRDNTEKKLNVKMKRPPVY